MKGSRLKTLAANLLVCFAAAALAACSIIATPVKTPSAKPAATTKASATAHATHSPKATASHAATAKPTASATASPTATTAPTASPDPDGQYYSDVEKVTVDPAGGHWLYQSPTLSVDVKRVTTQKPNLNYYVADIRTKDVGLLQSCYAGDDHSGKVRAVPELIAAKNKCVIAVTSDFFNNPYTSGTNKKGIIIRDGMLRSDKKGADCMAILPSGEFKIYKPGEITADALLALGVKSCYSFGPGLVRDGQVMPGIMKHALAKRNPRSGVGMIEPGHYIFIVVDGREPKVSIGMNFTDFAQLFLQYGCKTAFNFDGGQSASMCFMGKQLNIMHVQDDGFVQRRMPDVFAIGTSELANIK